MSRWKFPAVAQTSAHPHSTAEPAGYCELCGSGGGDGLVNRKNPKWLAQALLTAGLRRRARGARMAVFSSVPPRILWTPCICSLIHQAVLDSYRLTLGVCLFDKTLRFMRPVEATRARLCAKGRLASLEHRTRAKRCLNSDWTQRQEAGRFHCSVCVTARPRFDAVNE